MVAINDHLRKEGRSTKAELIVPLPGETKETFIKGLNNVLNSNTASVTIYTLMMLHGTMFKNPDYRKQYEMEGKFRLVPLNFGEYLGIAYQLKDDLFDVMGKLDETGKQTNLDLKKNLLTLPYIYIKFCKSQ